VSPVRLAGATLALLLLASCGYRPVHAVRDPLGPFAVVTGPIHAPEAALAAALAEGARAELARAGELSPSRGGAPAEIEVELLRVDETPEGIALAAPDLPLARGLRITVLGRARLRRAGSAGVERDTGDVRAGEVVARAAAAAPAVVMRDEGGLVAARRLGEILVRRLLGFPEPGEP
jgi:hypothetical protein